MTVGREFGRERRLFFYKNMAPSGRNKALVDPKNREIKEIDDLDLASTGSRAEYNRSPSINIPLVVRAATFKANSTKENDDLNTSETLAIQQKLNPEHELEEGPLYDVLYLPNDDIECLGGVDRDTQKSQDISGWMNVDQTQASTNHLRTWRSSGKGKKRKKLRKRKGTKRQKTSVLMVSVNESMQTLDATNGSSSDSELSSADESDDVKVMTNNTNKMKMCRITAGDGKNKTSTKGGCVTTQAACGAVGGSAKPCRSPAEQRRGNGAGDDGDDGDDERGKPPRKPPEHTVGKIKKPEQPCQPEQPQQFLMALNNNINHSNFCKAEPCKRCQWVQAMVQHSFDEQNGTCKCSNCRLWFVVLKVHTSVCQIQDCKVCKRANKLVVKPTATATVVQQNELNVPTCGQSLDQDDLIVWRDKCFPSDMSHFREDTEYILSAESFDKGGHGTVYNIDVSDAVKKKCFNSRTKDLIVKKDGLIETLGNVARVKKNVQNTRLRILFHVLFLTLTAFLRVWIMPYKHRKHKCKKVGPDELYVLQQTSQHPNFVETHCVVQKTHPEPHDRIVMEKCELSLKAHLRNLVLKGKYMDMYECMFYWCQTLDALKYLHHLRTGIPVIHKDIKAENVLLSIKDNLVRVKLADYDTVKLLHHEFTQPGLRIKGTPGLISPEVLRQQPHGRPADVWNMGMFFLQLLFVCDFHSFQKKLEALKDMRSIVAEVQNFIREKLEVVRNMDNDLADLIHRCLDDEPSRRPTAIEISQHPAVTKYTKTKVNMDELISQIRPVVNA